MHSPEYVAKKGLRILFKNKGELVPGFINKLSLLFLKFIPDFVVRIIFIKDENKAILKKLKKMFVGAHADKRLKN